MARPTKVEIARRQERRVRAEKAIESLTAQFARLLSKHSENLFKPDTAVAAQMSMNIDGEGTAYLRFEYNTRVVDGARFPLDQQELPMQVGAAGPDRTEEPTPETPMDAVVYSDPEPVE